MSIFPIPGLPWMTPGIYSAIKRGVQSKACQQFGVFYVVGEWFVPYYALPREMDGGEPCFAVALLNGGKWHIRKTGRELSKHKANYDLG